MENQVIYRDDSDFSLAIGMHPVKEWEVYGGDFEAFLLHKIFNNGIENF